MGSRSVVTAAFIGAGLLVVGSLVFLRSPSPGSDETGAGEGLGDVLDPLCRARDRATADADEARRIFLDEAHGPLHVLADEVAARDRAAAADLLETKQAVESRLEDLPLDEALLARDLESLIEATVHALAVVEAESAGCG